MQISKTIGILDIIIAVFFWVFGIFRLWPMYWIILILGLILLTKGILFAPSFKIGSFLDILCALIIIGASSGYVNSFAVMIIAIFLFLKGIFTIWGY